MAGGVTYQPGLYICLSSVCLAVGLSVRDTGLM